MDSTQPQAQSGQLNLGLKILSGLAFIAGLGIGLLALFASLGVWFGLWEFGQGFSLLRTANGYADVIAIFALISTVAILAASKFFNTGSVTKLCSAALIGTIAAGLAYYIPESFRAPEGVSYPPIHDVSTDTVNPLQFVDVIPLRVDAANTMVYGGTDDMTPSKLAQLQTEAYPDLVAHYYDLSEQEVFAKALQAVNQLGWNLVAQVPDQGRIEATATTFWFRFKDDVVIKIHREGDQTVVNARSLSRVGRGDVGANAIRLRAFFELMESS
ncbi:MAG: hypothetical protein COC19_04555 [SAR86 cluster bacterium]|uniref:DUF1499 domain-containing protein n=1 Tax=SAR86 cluster bacterium TaxID=2030880 RepID=A0A2A4MPL4_9GAMM|nr:MAG: hypothetical protein COC19_04555 [SAR86 cluster bacterium]